MKKIIHSKVQMNENGNSIMTQEMIQNTHDYIQETLGDDYVVITTPTELNIIDGDTKIITIDCKDYSYNELIDIINKAGSCDGLCK